MKGKMIARPYESSNEISEIIYDEANFSKDYLRIIVSKPPKSSVFPIMMLIQGYTCYSVDNLNNESTYKKIIRGLNE